MGTSLVVQCSRLHASNAGSVGSILVRELCSHMLCSAANKRVKRAVSIKYVIVVQSLSYVLLFATLWTIACQAPLSVEFSRQEYWSQVPFFLSRGSSQPRD